MNAERLLIGLALAAGLTACKEKDGGEETPAPAVNAQTIIVTPQAFTETLGAIGTVVTRAGHVATLSAPTQARVAQVLVSAGQSVTAGQTLVQLDQAPIAAALQAAEAAYTAAQRAAERQQRLANEGIAPRKDAETAAADMAKAHSDVVAAQRLLELSTLRAPISGVVTKMSATLGATADPAQPLVEIADPSALDVLLNTTPSDAGRVRVGAKVALSAGSTSTGDALGIGTVADIAGTVDSAARGVAIRVQASATRRPLKIGETVFGAIALGTNPSAIVIPMDALVPEGETFKVFVVDQTQTAHAREVKVGGRSDRGVEITEGLTAGERIVSTGAYAVSDSAKVVPLSATPGEPVGGEKGEKGEKGDAKKGADKKDDDEKDSAAAAPAARPGKP
jgi:RND family efflux transporter MFP subunit